jgi:methylated-DNA-protein-cysteine methyltransferase-like protein
MKSPKETSKFKKAVLKVVTLVPRGKVVSYGQVSLYIGMPRAARQVGWILNGLGEDVAIPWWRVVNNAGRISIKGSLHTAREQRDILEKEGLTIMDDLTFDIEKYRFIPDAEFKKALELDPVYLEMIAKNVSYSKIMNFKRVPRTIAKEEARVRK